MKIGSIIVENILECVPVGLLVIDPKGEIVVTNRAASEILGYPQAEFKGRGWGHLFFDSDKNDDFNQVFLDVIQEKRVGLRRRVKYTKETGETLILSITTSFLKENEEVAGIVVLMDDITEIDRVRRRERVILEEKNRIQRQRAEGLQKLSLAVAHQIRNPVTSIGGFSMRILKTLEKDDPSASYVHNILTGTKRLEDIVKAVSEYADLSPVVPAEVLISDILEKARVRVDQEAIGLSKKVNWNIRVEPIEVEVDPELFSQALNEILSNSLESFRGGEGSIAIVVFEDVNNLRVEIADNGAGVSEEDIPYIFDPFFTTKAVGVGMGLCKAQRIIAEHRGEISVESSPGKGTKVTIKLPGKRILGSV
jgi:PAS domain S-box-containing protein